MAADKIDTIVSLSKRRGFVYPCSEIYGGQRAAWDYGPLGVELKENIKRQWWRYMVTSREDVVGIDSSVILAPEVWEASGHVATFTDPLTECTSCHKRFRADHLEEAYEAKHGRLPGERPRRRQLPATAATRAASPSPSSSPACSPRTSARPRTPAPSPTCAPRPPRASSPTSRQVQQTSRKKPPFGIAQMGKSFRNEITPGNFIFRTREFEQMEMEFFVKPGEDEKWQEYWMEQRWNWYTRPGHPRGEHALVRAPGGEALPLLQAHRRHRVPLPASAAASGASSRASPTAPTSTSPRTPRPPARTCRTSTRRPASAGRRTSSSRRPVSAAPCSPSCSTRTSRTRRPTPRASWRSAP